MKLSIKHFKIVAFFLMKALLLTSFNAASYASDYAHNTLKHASKSEWTQALRSADKQEAKDSEYLTLWMYATADNKKAQLDRHVTWQDMKALIENRDYWPQQTMLKTVFEQKMPFEKSVSGQAMDAVAWFDEHAPETTRGMKIYLSALKAHGQGDLAAKKINDLKLYDLSDPSPGPDTWFPSSLNWAPWPKAQREIPFENAFS